MVNSRGDIEGLNNYAGELKVRYTYDSWGKLIETEDDTVTKIGVINPFRYRGYYYDVETGFYYVSSRYYDPEVGRWLNADSIIDNRGVGTQNLYVYCGNNPVNNIDSSGHLFGVVIGGIVGGILGGITAAVSGKSIEAGIMTGAVTGAIIGGICDFTTSGLLAATLCAGVAAGGNAWNQYENYKKEKKQYNTK